MRPEELRIIRDKCLLFNHFMIESGLIPKELIGAYQESNQLIEVAYQEGKAKILKGASADIYDQVIRHMPLSMAVEVKKLFKEKLKIDFAIVKKDRLKAIEKILKTGKISTEEEFELVVNRIDEIYSDPGRKDEIKLLNKILASFER